MKWKPAYAMRFEVIVPACKSIDNGLFTAVAFQVMSNSGKLLENLVFTELTKKFGSDNVSFHNEKNECDFIVKNQLETIAIQVCYELSPQNRPREIHGLNTAMEKFSSRRGYIITFNQEEVLTANTQVIPFWKVFGWDGELTG